MNLIGVGTGTDALGTVGQVVQTGLITGAGNLTKVGGGTLALTGTNGYTGQTIIGTGTTTGGVVNMGSQFALGSVVGGVVVNTNSTLKAIWLAINTFADYQAYNLTLNGTGYVGANLAGAFVDTVNGTFQGNITVNAGSSIGVNSGFTFALPGVVSGTGDLTKVGTGTLSLQAGNTYTGNTVVDAGTLALTLDGSALTSPNFIVNPNATLALDNFGTYALQQTNGNTNAAGGIAAVNLGPTRTSSTQGVTLNAGTLNFLANSGTGLVGLATAEQIGTVTLGAGQSSINTGFGYANNAGVAGVAGFLTIPPSGASAVLTIAGLTRQTGGTVNFTGYGLDQTPRASPSAPSRRWSATTAASFPTPRSTAPTSPPTTMPTTASPPSPVTSIPLPPPGPATSSS